MKRQIACLSALLLAACSAENPELRVMVAQDVPRASAVTAEAWLRDADYAGDARAFFLAQADFYLAGASTSGDSKLADVLRAMGRDDLVDEAEAPHADYACPRQWVEPLEMISRAARDTRIVIIETAHHAAEQSAFAEEVVARLAADGFTAFADDGLTLGPGGASHQDVLLVSEGLVTRDPGHGRLLREVKRNRLQLVDAGVWWTSADELASLSLAEQAARRQVALANQVSRRVFTRGPGARVIFYTERSADQAASAALKADVGRRTGQEPLLIALTGCADAFDEPAYLPSYQEGQMPQGGAELVFAIPRAAMKAGRRTAGRNAGEHEVPVPAEFLEAARPLLVEARRTSDPDLAVPEDRVMLFAGDALPLILPDGDYRIEAWTKDGPAAAVRKVSIN